MEFKGTKGKWFVSGNNEIVSMPFQMKIAKVYRTGVELEEDANAYFISIAPEMFKELQETVIDLKILQGNIRQEITKGNHLWEGMDQVVQKWIERKELLIK